MNKAVITADIIHSRNLDMENRAWLLKEIKRQIKAIDRDFDTISEIYRGDSIQIVVNDIKDALRVALILKTFIRSLNPSEQAEIFKDKKLVSKRLLPVWMYDVRIAIGIGKIEHISKNVVTSDGEAFQISGLLLDKIKDKRQKLAIETSDEHHSELKIESLLLDAILERTTALQAEVLYYKLYGYTEVRIANELDINQSAVNQRSMKGNWNVISEYLNYFEEKYE